ncbi:MAG: hypothetical protein ACYDDF_04805 [Thermoplasmatota archaeon]
MARTVRIPFIQRRIRVGYLVALLSITATAVGAFAQNVTVVSSTQAGYQGAYFVDNGYFTVGNIAYNVIQSSQPATSQPMTWASPWIGYDNANTAGHWELSLVLTIQSNAQASHTYTLAITATSADGSTSSPVGNNFQIAVPSSFTTGQTMTIITDVGSTWSAPSALQVTIT